MRPPRSDWRDEAECATGGYPPDLWFEPDTTAEAITVCRTLCPVREECLAWSLTAPSVEHGVFGGITPRQRRERRSMLRSKAIRLEREAAEKAQTDTTTTTTKEPAA